jgi:hypothetical protein
LILEDPGGAEGASDRPDRPKQLLVAGGSLLATAALVALVFSLGSWAYQHRRDTLHDGRLRRMLEQKPSLEQVTQGLLEEGNHALPTPRTEQELRGLFSGVSAARADDAVKKAHTWPTLRVFAARETVYILYFDDGGVLRDYAVGDNLQGVATGRPGG